jgi:hypothetical protein
MKETAREIAMQMLRAAAERPGQNTRFVVAMEDPIKRKTLIDRVSVIVEDAIGAN